MDFEYNVLFVSFLGAGLVLLGYFYSSHVRFKKTDYRNKIIHSRVLSSIKIGYLAIEVYLVFKSQIDSKTILPQVLVIGFVYSSFKVLDDYYTDIQKYENLKEK